MLKNKLFGMKYRAEAGDGGGSGSDGGGSGSDVQAMIAAEVEKAKTLLEKEYAGLKATNQQLKLEKQKVLDANKKLEGIDVDALLAMKANLDQSEEARMFAEGKADEVFAKRTERMSKDHQSTLTALTTELESERKKSKDLAAAKKELLIDGKVRDAALKAGVRADALDYVLRLAHDVYDEDATTGDIIPRDRQGNLILGKDATNPQPMSEWMEELRTKAEFVFPSSTGSGATGSQGRGGKGGYTAEAIAGMTPSEYAKLRKEGKIK